MSERLDIEPLISGYVYEVRTPAQVNHAIVQDYNARLSVLLDQAAQPIHLIVDVRHVKMTLSVTAWTNTSFLHHPNLGEILLIGLDQVLIVRYIALLVQRATGITLLSFPSREAVMTHLAAKGLTLPTEVPSRL